MSPADLEYESRIHYVDDSKPTVNRRMPGGTIWRNPKAFCGDTFGSFNGYYNHSMYTVGALEEHVKKKWMDSMCPHCLENMGIESLGLYE